MSEQLSSQPAHPHCAGGQATSLTGQALSDSAASAVRCALQAHLQGRVCPEGMRAALRVLCAEGRRRRLHAEHLLVTLKGVWASLPEARQEPYDARQRVLEWLVTACVEEFYGPSDRRAPDDPAGRPPAHTGETTPAAERPRAGRRIDCGVERPPRAVARWNLA